MQKFYKLILADGFALQITAGDAEALPVVEMLARVMTLASGEAEHELLVLTGQETEPFFMNGETIVCRFSPHTNQDDLVSKVMKVSLAIAHAAQKRGGVLVHGGLAEYEGKGVILAAPGGTGKTTASTRLPAPWCSLSDDAVLIVRDAQGNYYGHPWPTWSRFYLNGPGGTWNTAYNVPLKALYLLFQSPDDDLEGLNPNQATAMLVESVEQANSVFSRTLPPAKLHANHREQFAIVCAITDRVPAYRLHLSLNGTFWPLIEESLKRPANDDVASRMEEKEQAETFAVEKTAPTSVVFSGNSMYPTLKEPGCLDVRPYGNEKPRRGDVVYFLATASKTMVVHRVMALRPHGLVTRGDNNSQNDPDVVPLSAVEGKVIAIRDARRNKQIRGGRAGLLVSAYSRIFRRAKPLAGRMYRLLLRTNSITGSLRYFAPKSVRFQFVFFGRIPLGQLKILSNDICVGHYSRGIWHIAYPWRLWIDPAKIEVTAQQVESAKAQWQKALIEKSDTSCL